MVFAPRRHRIIGGARGIDFSRVTGREEAVRIRIRNQQDLLAGILFLAIAFGALWVSSDYPMGSAVRMSSGYVPRLLCLLLIAIGGYVLLRALAVEGPSVTAIKLRPLLMITASVVIFAATIERLGVVIATVLLTVIGGYASPRVRFREMIAAAAVLVGIVVALFVWGLELPIPLWPEF
jgi:hypothetical protein